MWITICLYAYHLLWIVTFIQRRWVNEFLRDDDVMHEIFVQRKFYSVKSAVGVKSKETSLKVDDRITDL